MAELLQKKREREGLTALHTDISKLGKLFVFHYSLMCHDCTPWLVNRKPPNLVFRNGGGTLTRKLYDHISVLLYSKSQLWLLVARQIRVK